MPIGRRYLTWMLGLWFLGGCTFPVREEVDRVVCDLAAQPTDAAASPLNGAGRRPEGGEKGEGQGVPKDTLLPPPRSQLPAAPIVPAIPKELPGANARMLELPDSIKDEAAWKEAIRKIYQSLPPMGPDPQPVPPPEGRPWTLADLQRIALGSSPLLRQAAAAVQSAQGVAINAGLPPNPMMGYEADVMGTGGSAGLQGAWFEQLIKTAGKLKLAQAAALMEVYNAQLALTKARADLNYNVRNLYFAVLVARRNMAISQGLVQLTDDLFSRHVRLVLAGSDSAPWEPTQLRAIAWTARGLLITARLQYVASWKSLAAAMGRPDLPLTELAGDITVPVPIYDYDQTMQWVLQNHTDVHTADNSIAQARYNLHLAQVTPFPDVNVRIMVQKDNTTFPHEVVPSVVLGLPIPLWNRNQGGIRQAQGNLMQQVEEPHRVRSQLVAQLADAFQRYRDGLALLEIYQNGVIPDQVRAYLHTYESHLVRPTTVGFVEIVQAEQLLTNGISTYITTLGSLWTSVADIAHLLQTNDLYHDGDGAALPTWTLPPLPELPCCHPCSPLTPKSPQGADGSWPVGLPQGISTPSPPGMK